MIWQLVLLAAFGSVQAHTIFQEVLVNGASQGHKQGIRVPSYDGSVDILEIFASSKRWLTLWIVQFMM
jgi:hypothetical protein